MSLESIIGMIIIIGIIFGGFGVFLTKALKKENNAK